MTKAREVQKTHSIHQYLVVGRHHPTEKNPSPKIYKMRIFANDVVRAKSKFWYFLKKFDKVKKASGEILAIHEVIILSLYYFRSLTEILQK
jgi:large subunit ribosomal protein L18Ae